MLGSLNNTCLVAMCGLLLLLDKGCNDILYLSLFKQITYCDMYRILIFIVYLHCGQHHIATGMVIHIPNCNVTFVNYSKGYQKAEC